MILYDARGNELKVNLDTITNEVVIDNRTIFSLLSSLNAEVIMDLNGNASAIFDLRTAAMNATLVFEGTVDGTNYFGLPGFDVLTEAYLSAVVVTTTLAKVYVVGCSGIRRIRVRISAYSSGTITVATRATQADFAIYAKPIPSSIGLTATAAINVASTATLAAAGAGLFHYITKIELVKLYGVVGVAAGAGVIVTSTNLVGNPAWTTEQRAGAAGDAIKVIDWEPGANPIKSSVVNTATTFVAPLQLQTIWRWNIQYYVGA